LTFISIYKKALHNRPKLISREESVCVFECSEKKGEIYFSQFLDMVEIIEPSSLRNYFEGKYQKALEQYK